MRIVGPFCVAVLIALGLFWLMFWMITPPEGPVDRPRSPVDVAIALPDPEPEPEPEDLSQILEAAPEPPPSVPDLISADAVSVSAPDISVPTPSVSVPVKFSSGGASLGEAFGGFGGGSGSAGSGQGGYGTGKGFSGKKLVPLSTARPQIPETAFEQGLEGWVEVVFVVTAKGRVSNIRIIDAEPKGVFEAAMVESISNWIYPSHPSAREVKQRFEFKLGDFRYNWN